MKESVAFDPFMYLSLPIPTSNQRLFAINYFPFSGKPLKYGVRAPKTGQIKDLKAQLAELVGISAEQIILSDVYSHRAFLTLPDKKYLFDVRSSDVIHAYEGIS